MLAVDCNHKQRFAALGCRSLEWKPHCNSLLPDNQSFARLAGTWYIVGVAAVVVVVVAWEC